MNRLFDELKRRNVFRVGAAYAVAGWLIVQIVETVQAPLGLPGWTVAFFIVLIGAGLPVALIFAWAFELTPEGLKKTREVDRSASVTAATGKKLNFAIIVCLVLALGYFLWERQGLIEQAEVAGSRVADRAEVADGAAASIAVLPFVNMSADPEQEYFSDGISEELLNVLAKIPELRVAARTSSFQFKGQNLDIAKVAEQLNVRHVLEGSVRKADVRVRVTAQLIEADSGYHLWSETYDRELTDIFAIQDEISAAIVAALSDALGISPTARPQVSSAANADAYNAYLLGQHFIKLRTKEDVEASIPNFERAIELDPAFAPAHAGLGLAWYLMHGSSATYGTLTLEESLSRSLPHLERALQLDPALPEALGAMGLTLSARYREPEALAYYEKALAVNPSLTDVRNWYSADLDTLDRLDESFEQIETAYRLDPLSVLTLNNYVNDLVNRKRFEQAEPALARLEQMDPGRGLGFRGGILEAQGRAGEGAVLAMRAVDVSNGDWRAASVAAWAMLRLGLDQEALEVWPNKDFTLPIVSNSGDTAYGLELAREAFEEDSQNPGSLWGLAIAHWRAGNFDDASRLAERYLGQLSPLRRPIDGANFIPAFDAWKRADVDELRHIVGPVLESQQRNFDSGLAMPFPYLVNAVFLFLADDRDAALARLRDAYSAGTVALATLANLYERLGWNELPEFVALRRQYEEYVRKERRHFLAVACGEDGFVSWKPAADTCTRIDET